MNYKLIEKYIQGKASVEEVECIINATLESPKFKAELLERIKINALTNDAEFDVDIAWSEFQNNIKSINRKRKMQVVMKIAAIFMIGVFVATLVFKTNKEEINENEIVLELSNGTKKIINTATNSKIINANGEIVGEQVDTKIVFTGNEEKDDKIEYNTLYVPYGKRFQVEFSDGSVAYLNSGTNIKFPVQFKKGKPRKVYLDGEAYFDITKDKDHSFIVGTNTLDTKVYGTKFNVSSYKSDNKNEVVLVEGKVSVSKNNSNSGTKKETYLKPHQMAFLNDPSQEIKVNNVNPNDYTSWIKGELVFNDLLFADIIRKLERHYNVEIDNNYTELNNIRFTGNFDIESIEQVLRSFSNYRDFKYTINNNQIYINSNK
jgi:hypothetical protein